MLVVKNGMFLVLRSVPVKVDFNRAALLMTTYIRLFYIVNVVIMLLFYAFFSFNLRCSSCVIL